MKLDILVFAAHPDDAELACSGAILKYVSEGKKVGIIDFTKGEMGSRGTPEIRIEEANESAKLMGVVVRENLGFSDSYFQNDKAHQETVVQQIRKYQPTIVLANALNDRHPDHGEAAEIVKKAIFMSGLVKLETEDENGKQDSWRPNQVYHYIQSQMIEPDFVLDVSSFWEKKIKAIKTFKSQFHDPNSQEAETYISSPEFLKMIEARGKEFGHSIGVEYGEGFNVTRNIGVSDLFSLI